MLICLTGEQKQTSFSGCHCCKPHILAHRNLLLILDKGILLIWREAYQFSYYCCRTNLLLLSRWLSDTSIICNWIIKLLWAIIKSVSIFFEYFERALSVCFEFIAIFLLGLKILRRFICIGKIHDNVAVFFIYWKCLLLYQIKFFWHFENNVLAWSRSMLDTSRVRKNNVARFFNSFYKLESVKNDKNKGIWIEKYKNSYIPILYFLF